MSDNNRAVIQLSSVPDLHADWLNILRRIKKKVANVNGAGIVTISVVVNPDAEPMFWTEPQLILFEPMSRADEIIQFLSRR